MITKYHIINYDKNYFTKDQFLADAEAEYQEELEGVTPDDGYDSLEEAKENAADDDVIYEVRWQKNDGKCSVFDYISV